MLPLRFTPILKRYLWGGRRLGEVLGKRLGPEPEYAESWEVCDHGQDQSVVACGPLKGQTLAALVRDFPRQLLGRHAPLPRFPLLFKFLDAQQTLSVQVHPNDQAAARLIPPDLGKTEAWVVLDAVPGSVVYAGLKRGFDRPALQRELARGTCELCLHRLTPLPGDCIFLPAGTVHAIGAGLLIAEIQQASDTTWRLFDWNRIGTDGRPRALHVEAALAAIDYGRGPCQPQSPLATDDPRCQTLVTCDKFILRRWTSANPWQVGGDDRCHLLAVLEGEIEVEGDPAETLLPRGGTTLIPADAGVCHLVPTQPSVVLEAYLP